MAGPRGYHIIFAVLVGREANWNIKRKAQFHHKPEGKHDDKKIILYFQHTNLKI